MFRLPTVYGVGEARKEMATILDEVAKGETFIVKGTKGREALLINAETFRRLQDAYLSLVSEVETYRILEDEEAMAAIEADSGGGDADESDYSLSEVEQLIRGGGENGGSP